MARPRNEVQDDRRVRLDGRTFKFKNDSNGGEAYIKLEENKGDGELQEMEKEVKENISKAK